MKPYKLKHIPTGLYYQPGRNNLSEKGKIYYADYNILKGDRLVVKLSSTSNIYKRYKTEYLMSSMIGLNYKGDMISDIKDWVREDI
ncbi:hypothetical protein [Flavobacterium sp.]|jgi:hypothetical protein|uniref:hypothetical protein n=1 Tax=Flavobacterium sp. TaxID=239 RepID=UPI0037BF8C02